MTRKEAINKAMLLFDEGYACSQSILLTFCGRYGLDEKNAKLIASTFGGGMGRLREKCGAVTGGFMVLGLAYGNANPQDMKTKLNAYQKVRNLDRRIKDIHGTSACAELLIGHVTESDVIKRNHHKKICCQVVGEVAGILYDMLDDSFNQSG